MRNWEDAAAWWSGRKADKLARKHLRHAELVNNDQTIATGTGADLGTILKYSQDLLDAGAPIDAHQLWQDLPR